MDPAKAAVDLWTNLRDKTPEHVDPTAWLGLLEYVAIKLAHLLGGQSVRPFVHDMLDPRRFAHLKRK